MPAEDNTDDLLCTLMDFLDNKLLFWIEAMNLIGAKSECSSLLKDAKSWLETVRTYSILFKQSYLNAFPGKGMAGSHGTIGRCDKLRRFLCRKHSIKINTTFIHIGVVNVESGLANIQELGKPVWVYSINFTAKGSYHNTFAYYTYE